MPDKLVEIAAYSHPVEAQVARGLLEAEGIRAVLEGEGAVNVFSGVQGLGGKITLHVAAADAERALALLADVVEGPPDDSRLWLCPLCGDAVDIDALTCPACATPRPEEPPSRAVTTGPMPSRASWDIQEERPPERGRVTADTPVEAVPSAVEDDLDIPDPETFLGDDLVRRAFLSSWVGVLAPYSLWLLVRLAFYPGKISPRMMPRFYLAVAIDAFWCLLLLVLCRELLLPY